MVIGIAMMSAMVPTIIGLNEATKGARESEDKRRENEKKSRFHLVAACDIDADSESRRQEVHNASVYLGSDKRLYITKHPTPSMTAFNGHFFELPDLAQGNLNGLVAISGETPPTLRWVYLDKNTYEMRWGGKQDREGHIGGPFDLTRDGDYLALNDTQRWLALRLEDTEQDATEAVAGVWRLCCDWEENNGASLSIDTPSMPIYLRRVLADS
ncbi:hypothetical protein AFCA_013214 [Aspergillus flavus]|uniref:Uncharacterized protein n=1 Tax=Aspergillus flavus TaxID=5059 RepID=A0AB74CCL8_ASPFL|nr:hypothetical protein AFLA_013580 [Aspergillus flavus NRRL3357]KOC18796.1 hypothetical protein AFLA70_4g008921 [Aspergillus flavus AF70]RAQ62205.1 hypothetical protein COH20_002956 [Aspergillus flavus]RAQ79103.1 hypothetical protein COH21_005339 [Aspergillus flavus]RMZ44361.1 hypothetical protein CA14_004449 [Aspergillus flavus]